VGDFICITLAFGASRAAVPVFSRNKKLSNFRVVKLREFSMSMLDQILESTRQRVQTTRAAANLRELEQLAARHEVRGFRRALVDAGASGIAIIAELKKASPSKGLIRKDFDAAKLATELAESGAAALSVLTNAEYFQGSLENLRVASDSCSVPCLRKDFIVDEFQILEARAFGADAVLLIVAGLTDVELRSLGGAARSMAVDVLCEVHDGGELRRALDAGFETIGVNNRNLKTFAVNLETAVDLGKAMPAGVLRVAESGIESPADIARLKAAGFSAFLVGEHLMRAQRPGSQLRELMRPACQQLGE
jgi:indole-3-glycerol phosphate synthase